VGYPESFYPLLENARNVSGDPSLRGEYTETFCFLFFSG
jgi:hypothetical protein